MPEYHHAFFRAETGSRRVVAVMQPRRFSAGLLILAATLILGVAAFAGNAHAQVSSSTPVAVQFQGEATPTVVPGRAAATITVELIARDEATALSGHEQALVRFLGSDADGGELHFDPPSFVLSGNQISGSGLTREVKVSADPRARGPTDEGGARGAVSVTIEVQSPRGEVHTVTAQLYLRPQFHLTFNPPGVFVTWEQTDVTRRVGFGLFGDTSLPVEGESVRVANDLAWTPTRPPSLTQAVNIAGTTLDAARTTVSVGFVPLSFAEETPSSQAFSIAPGGEISVTHPTYAPGSSPAATASVEPLSLQTRKRSEEVYYAGYPSVPSDFNPHHLTFPLLPKYLWGPNPSFEWELGRDFQISVVVTPPVHPSVIGSPDPSGDTVRKDSVTCSTTTRDGLAVAGVDYVALAGEQHTFQCADADAIEGYCESLAYVRLEKAPGATVESSSNKQFYVDKAYVRVRVDDVSQPRNNLLISPPTAEIEIRAPSISLVSDDEEFLNDGELLVERDSVRRVRLSVGKEAPLQSGEEGVFRASVEMGDGSALTVTPSTFALTAAQPTVDLAIAGGEVFRGAWEGWGILRVDPVKPSAWRPEADPPVRLLNDEPAEFRLRSVIPFIPPSTPSTLEFSPASPIRTTAGGATRTVTVSLGGSGDSFFTGDPLEFEVRLRSDVPGDVPGGGLSITPSVFRLSSAAPRREVGLRASPRARGPLNDAGELGPAELTAEVFVVTDAGMVETTALFSTTATLTVGVRFHAAFEPPELTLVAGHPVRGADTAVLSLLQTPSRLAAGEEVTLSILPGAGSPDPDGVSPGVNLATFSESVGTTGLRLTASGDAPVQTFSLRAEWSGSGGVRYAPGHEPEVSSSLLEVNVQDEVRLKLTISATEVQVMQGGTARITVTTDSPLRGDEAATVTFTAAEESGVRFDGGSESAIRLTGDDPSREVEISTLPTAPVGGVSSVAVTVSPSAGLGFAALSSPAMTVEVVASVTVRLADAAAVEGGTAEVALTFSGALNLPRTWGYSLGSDPDPATADADADDYEDLGGGAVTVAAGAVAATIRVLIRQDDDVEPLRETIRVALSDVPAGYVPARTTAAITIREGVCDRTPAVADALIGATGAGDCADVADLSGVTELAVDTAGVSVLKPLDLSGLAGLRNLSLADRVSTLGESRGLTTLSGEEFAGLSGLTSLDLSLNRFDDTGLSAAVFRHLTGLTELNLSHNNFSGENLPDDLFGHLGGLRSLRLTGSSPLSNVVTTLPAGIFSGLGDLRVLDLSGHRKQTADSLQVLRDLPAGVFAGLGSLTSLNLSDSEVVFRLGFVRTGGQTASDEVGEYRLSVDLGAPYSFTVALETTGGTASTPRAAIAAGSTRSATFTVTQAANPPLTLAHGAPSTNLADPGNANNIRFLSASTVIFNATGGPVVAAVGLKIRVFLEGALAPRVTVSFAPAGPVLFDPGSSRTVTLGFSDYELQPGDQAQLRLQTQGDGFSVDPVAVTLDADVPTVEVTIHASSSAETGVLEVTATRGVNLLREARLELRVVRVEPTSE